jgi:glyoxylase-like metal-dependent hydrolase (beta-lactamase superfamily II)
MRIIVGLVLVLGFNAASAQDAAALLKRAAAAIGEPKSIRYAASGTGHAYGQSYQAGKPGPKLNWGMTRSIDYETGSMSDALVLSRAENPPRGGAAVPISGEARQMQMTSGAHAWNQVAALSVPAPLAVEDRQHQLWITPHGVIRAAQRNNATVRWVEGKGEPLAAVSFTEPGKFSATAFINDGYLVERVESRFPNPVSGDTLTVTEYSDYRSRGGGVWFPNRIRQTLGAQPGLDLTVGEVQVNAPVAIQVPDVVRSSGVVVRSEKAAEGVWYIAGGTHHSVAIEMKDHVVVVEGPQFDGRAIPVIDETKKLIPGKPIRYVVNTHPHFDHAGGLRAFAAEGATIVTHAENAPFFQKIYGAPWKIKPDRLAKSGKKAAFKAVKGKTVLSDGARSLEIHPIEGNLHNSGFVMVWMPKERLLIEGDAFTPGAAGSPPPSTPNPVNVNLVENIERLKLDVDRILPIHGRIVPLSELRRATGR